MFIFSCFGEMGVSDSPIFDETVEVQDDFELVPSLVNESETGSLLSFNVNFSTFARSLEITDESGDSTLDSIEVSGLLPATVFAVASFKILSEYCDFDSGCDSFTAELDSFDAVISLVIFRIILSCLIFLSDFDSEEDFVSSMSNVFVALGFDMLMDISDFFSAENLPNFTS
ncbi:hypothetical protein B7P43_G02743 [Cryptotermes secundus]|uniref:Uncharacterized protein n=1 Tax=Cryptotermes secundus TaxID=105785 RepID=A0A2J7PL04_9NEOP|nr:hypothetical protein B7P43_G02743 [Cryptotermes secundus]